MRRPETPIPSLITEPSLILAPSSSLPIADRASIRRHLRPVARQLPQVLLRLRRHETFLQQSVPQQVGDPLRVFLIRLPARHLFDLRRVAQRQVELPFQHRPHRLPVRAGRFHRHVCDAPL
jgi:hypothetical protein